MSPVLSGHENHIRRLVLEVRCTPWEFAEEALSDSHVKSMAAWGKQFPNLKVCVLLLCFVKKRDGGLRCFNESILRISNYEPSEFGFEIKKVTLEDMLVKIIAAFLRSGPGSRKIVRFGSGFTDSESYRVRPLTEITGQDPPITNTQHIFKQAYWEI
jgi:hypothetical protein